MIVGVLRKTFRRVAKVMQEPFECALIYSSRSRDCGMTRSAFCCSTTIWSLTFTTKSLPIGDRGNIHRSALDRWHPFDGIEENSKSQGTARRFGTPIWPESNTLPKDVLFTDVSVEVAN